MQKLPEIGEFLYKFDGFELCGFAVGQLKQPSGLELRVATGAEHQCYQPSLC